MNSNTVRRAWRTVQHNLDKTQKAQFNHSSGHLALVISQGILMAYLSRRAYFSPSFNHTSQPHTGVLGTFFSPQMALAAYMMVTEICLDRWIQLPYCHFPPLDAPGCLRHLYLAGRYDKRT